MFGRLGCVFAAASAELQEAVRCNPHDFDYRLLLGHWLEITGQGEASLIEYRRGLALVETARAKPHRTRRRIACRSGGSRDHPVGTGSADHGCRAYCLNSVFQ